MDQWKKPLAYDKTKAVLGLPGEEALVFNLFPREGLFSATDVRRTWSQGAALALAATTAEVIIIERMVQWGLCADVRRSPSQGVALAVAAKVRNITDVHRVAAHLSEEITQKTAQAMGIVTAGRWGSCEARLQAKAKRQAVQWINGPDKTSSDGIGDKDLGGKPGNDESVGKRGTPHLKVQGLELEQPPDPEGETPEAPPNIQERTQEAPTDPAEETREALSDPEENTRVAPPDSEQETEKKTREAPPNPEEETRETPSDPDEDTRETPSDPDEDTQKTPT